MSGASFTGPGAIKLDGPEIQFTGNMAFPALNMSNGSLKGQGNIDIAGNLNLSGGGIENAGFVQIGGALNWTGGGFGNGSTAAQVTVFGATNISGNGAVLRNRNLLMSKGGGLGPVETLAWLAVPCLETKQREYLPSIPTKTSPSPVTRLPLLKTSASATKMAQAQINI